MTRLVLLVAAVACFVVAALNAFGHLHGANIDGWGYLGLAAFAGSFLTR